jgi:hypothetical protein
VDSEVQRLDEVPEASGVNGGENQDFELKTTWVKSRKVHRDQFVAHILP